MIGIIVAYDKNKTIGYKGKIPWKIKGEQEQFKELTTNNIVVMGRKTYEEIGKPLHNRVNVIISSEMYKDKENYPGLYIYKYIEDFIDIYTFTKQILHPNNKLEKDFSNKDIFAIGGVKIFERFIDIADCIYVTKIHKEYFGDVKFPEISPDMFVEEILYDTFGMDKDKSLVQYTRFKYIAK